MEVEPGKFERNKPFEGVFVSFGEGPGLSFGFLDDISTEGCAFVYGARSRQTVEPLTVSIFPPDFSLRSLRQLPCRVIRDVELQPLTAGSILRRCELCFEALEEEQSRCLELFLELLSVGDKPAEEK